MTVTVLDNPEDILNAKRKMMMQAGHLAEELVLMDGGAVAMTVRDMESSRAMVANNHGGTIT